MRQQREPQGTPGDQLSGNQESGSSPGKRAGVVWPGLQRDGLGGDPLYLLAFWFWDWLWAGRAVKNDLSVRVEASLDRGYRRLDWSVNCLRFEELLGKPALLDAHHVPG